MNYPVTHRLSVAGHPDWPVRTAAEREGDASDEAALPPSGLSRCASQAKPAAAIAKRRG